MKTITYDLVIDSISAPFGRSTGSTQTVEVAFHREGGDLSGPDGHETKRMGVDVDGDIDAQVAAKLGTTETVEIDE